MAGEVVFNPPPGWPMPPKGWKPPLGWKPDPSWPAPPAGWSLWIEVGESSEPTEKPRNMDGSLGSNDSESRDQSVRVSEHRIAMLEAENLALRGALVVTGKSADAIVELDDERVLQEAGIYRYHHPLENAVAYRERLNAIGERVAEFIKTGCAIHASTTFAFEGSLAKGHALSSDLGKLMLRAYNAEAENVIRTLRSGNALAAVKRLTSAKDGIARLGKLMEMRISDQYHALRVEEIELTSDYLAKKEEERELARAERERLREERKVELELAAAREKLDKERSHILAVIDKVRATGEVDAELQKKLEEIDSAIAMNDFRAANIRAGYVYVISNRGAFGGHVVKIGLTRRLDPLERVAELGDASVPFKFDVHAIFFSEDAVGLEGELHTHFAKCRVNWANDRKEFFFASPSEVREVLSAKLGNLLEFVERAESPEYLQSIKYWPKHVHDPEPSSFPNGSGESG